MDEHRQAEILARLRGRTPALGGMSSSDLPMHEALDSMVDAGACRIGMRSDRAFFQGLSCNDLARPLARLIDHTALKPEVTEEDVRKLCIEADRYGFASVCVNPCNVALAASTLTTVDVAVCSVAGFPLGANRTKIKIFEAVLAAQDGATEVDMVLNVGWLRSGKFDEVELEIRQVVQAVGEGITVKVILECALLSDEEKVVACMLAKSAGADFVKTSTGFSSGGATTYDVALMRRVVGDALGVKASGGVRSRGEAMAMISHGATRIGASASVAIVDG